MGVGREKQKEAVGREGREEEEGGGERDSFPE